MADHADDDGDFDGDIFIYRGGRAPQHITHARIDKSLDEIEDNAFDGCEHLVQVDTHDGIRKIGREAFHKCKSLRRINLKSVVEIDEWAFYLCKKLESVEFGDRLETIGKSAFGCTSLTHLKLPSIITIGSGAFWNQPCLLDIEFSERLETIGRNAFGHCKRLQHIAIPLKRDLFEFSVHDENYNTFGNCLQLTTVDLVGGTHKTVASLHMESWRAEMISEINRINQILPNTPVIFRRTTGPEGITPTNNKTEEIREWMEMVLDKMDQYKAEHYRYVKEGVSLLELALWKAKLHEKEESSEEGKTRKVKVDSKSARKERRITCGADIVIKNVLPFLQLE